MVSLQSCVMGMTKVRRVFLGIFGHYYRKFLNKMLQFGGWCWLVQARRIRAIHPVDIAMLKDVLNGPRYVQRGIVVLQYYCLSQRLQGWYINSQKNVVRVRCPGQIILDKV